MEKKIKLDKELEGFYGTEYYYRVSDKLVLTDGIETLLKKLSDDFVAYIMLINVEKRLDIANQYGILFMKLIINDNKYTMEFYDDIPEKGHKYNYNETVLVDRFNDEINLENCEIKTFIQNGVWALMSEY